MSLAPMIRYQDAPAAMEFLKRAFGMETIASAAMPDGAIAHAEVRAGDGVVFVATLTPARRRGGLLTPLEAGGCTMGVYLTVADIDAHYERAKAAGAEIVMAIGDEPHGRGYVAKDPEGHLWAFNTYAPGR